MVSRNAQSLHTAT